MCGMELLLTPQVHTFMILHLHPPPNLGITNVLTQGGRDTLLTPKQIQELNPEVFFLSYEVWSV